MKDIYVHFYSAQNFGDDVFVLLLARRYPHIQFHISGEKSVLNAFQNVENIRIHNDSKWKKACNRILKKITGKDAFFLFRAKKCPLIVTIGGSIFIQPASERLEQYYQYKKNQRIPGKKSMILGANFGPYTSASFLEFFRKELAAYDFVSFRDQDSYALFQDLPNTQVAPDILFGIRALGELPPAADKENKKEYVVFSLIDKTRNREAYEAKICELIHFYHEKDMGVVLLSLCEQQGDVALCKTIQSKLPFAVECVSYDGNVQKVISCIANAAYVIGSRFHAVVAALAYHVPVLPVSYSNKTKNMLTDIQFSDEVIDIDDIYTLTLEEADANRVQGTYRLPETFAHESEQHFKRLDQICRNEKDLLA